MLAQAQHMLDAQANLMQTADYAAGAAFYDCPLAIHLASDILVYRSRLSVTHGLQTLFTQYREAGVQRIVPNITAIELERDGRFRLWVSWDHIYRDHLLSAASQVTYYCRLGPDHLKVEMCQYRALPVTVRTDLLMQASRPA